MVRTQENCRCCEKRIATHEYYIKCTTCNLYTHTNCLPNYTHEDIDYALTNEWTCPTCLKEFFPYNLLEDSTSFQEQINSELGNAYRPNPMNLIFDPLEPCDDDNEDILENIDPDQNFLNEIRGQDIFNCKYYYNDAPHPIPRKKQNRINLSLFSLNIRSLPKNFNQLVPLIKTSEINYNIICLTETWLTPSNAESYGLEGYTHEYLTRTNKLGGHTSIFIGDNIIYKTREDLTFIDNDMELLWLELDKKIPKY
jgi:hypothetical protein